MSETNVERLLADWEADDWPDMVPDGLTEHEAFVMQLRGAIEDDRVARDEQHVCYYCEVARIRVQIGSTMVCDSDACQSAARQQEEGAQAYWRGFRKGRAAPEGTVPEGESLWVTRDRVRLHPSRPESRLVGAYYVHLWEPEPAVEGEIIAWNDGRGTAIGPKKARRIVGRELEPGEMVAVRIYVETRQEANRD